MEALTKKTTVLFEPGKYKALKQIARSRGQTVGRLIRESVEARFGLFSTEERLRAVDAIGIMHLPTASWAEMEHEIEKGASEP